MVERYTQKDSSDQSASSTAARSLRRSGTDESSQGASAAQIQTTFESKDVVDAFEAGYAKGLISRAKSKGGRIATWTLVGLAVNAYAEPVYDASAAVARGDASIIRAAASLIAFVDLPETNQVEIPSVEQKSAADTTIEPGVNNE